MHLFKRIAIVSAVTLGVNISIAHAAELRQVGTIEIPGEKLTNFDISFIDQANQRYYFADRSNKSIDIFDVKTDKFVDRVSGFTGVVMKNGKPSNDTSGPDGVLSTFPVSFIRNRLTTLVLSN